MQLATIGAAVVIAIVALIAIAVEVGEEETDAAVEFLPTIDATPDASPTLVPTAIPSPGGSPTPEETQPVGPVVPTFPPLSESPIVRITIPIALVDSEDIVTSGLADDGVIPLPEDPQAVAYYEFSSRPGDTQGNAVFGGSGVRTADEEGLLANVPGLGAGDEIVITLEDGIQYLYRVFAVNTLGEAPALLPTDVGCDESGECSGLGTLTLIAFDTPQGTVIVQAQLLRGGP